MADWNNLSPDELYLQFYTLGHRERLSFFETYIRSNPFIAPKEKNEMAIDHLLALFEIGKYEKFLYEVDAMIEFVVEENIYQHNGEDAFRLLLFKKAAAHYNMEEMEASKSILFQLKKMDGSNNLYGQFIRRIDQHKGIWQSPFWQSMVVIGFAFSFIIYLLDIFLIEPFVFRWHEMVSLLCVSSMTVSFLLLAGLGVSYMRSKW